jgi:type IV fimbrial biogenesis protein FimT
MLKRHRAMRGVTLIELTVTLAVLSLLLFAVAPTITAWMRNTQVRNTALSILSGLQQARNEAIRRNEPIRFSLLSLTNSTVLDNSCALSNTGVSWVVSVRDPAGACQYAPVTPANMDETDPESYAIALRDSSNPLISGANAGGVGGRSVVVEAKLADGSTGASTVVFNNLGRIENAAPIGFVNVRNQTTGGENRRLRIEVSPGGSARLCDLDVTATSDSRYCPTRGTP